MKKTLFQRIVLRTWDFMMLKSFVGMLVALSCAVYFRTWVGILICSALSALFIFEWTFKRTIKKRACEKGTFSEADPETYLFRGNDGSELRVPKNSKWIFVERKNGKVGSIFYSPVCEFSTENGNPVPAPEIKTQQAPFSARKFIIGTLLIIAEIILITWLFGKYLPLTPRTVYRDSCSCVAPENCTVQSHRNTQAD